MFHSEMLSARNLIKRADHRAPSHNSLEFAESEFKTLGILGVCRELYFLLTSTIAEDL